MFSDAVWTACMYRLARSPGGPKYTIVELRLFCDAVWPQSDPSGTAVPVLRSLIFTEAAGRRPFSERTLHGVSRHADEPTSTPCRKTHAIPRGGVSGASYVAGPSILCASKTLMSA